MSSVVVAGDTSGAITIAAPSVSGTNTLTLPAVTDTLVGLAATQTLTNKSIAATQLTGTVAVANGGTGGSTSTGTGAVVLASSPSLTTPALGTPSTLVLTNATGLAAAAMPAGSIIQVVQTHVSSASSQASGGSGTHTNVTGLSVTITCRNSSSRVLIQARWAGEVSNAVEDATFGLRRGSTQIGSGDAAGTRYTAMSSLYTGYNVDYDSTPESCILNYVDSPATGAAITYYMTAQVSAACTIYNNQTVGATNAGNYERLSSTIIAMEIAG